MLGRVLSNVHGGKREPESCRAVHEPGQHPFRGQRTVVLVQGPPHHVELGEELLGTGVVEAWSVGRSLRHSNRRVPQLLVDVGTLLPVRLPGRKLAESIVYGRKQLGVGDEGLHELGRRGDDVLGLAELGRQLFDGDGQVPGRVQLLGPQHRHGDLRRHIGVAVAITANPRPKPEGLGCGWQRNAEAAELGGQLVIDVADGFVEQSIKDVDRRAGFAFGRGSLNPEFVRLPHQVDQLSDPALRPASIGRAGSSVSPRSQQVSNLHGLGLDRPTSGFGRVSGQDRSHLETLNHLVDDSLVDVALDDPIDGGFEMAGWHSSPQTVVLLGHVGQVEVRAERPHQGDGRSQVEALEQGGQLCRCCCGVSGGVIRTNAFGQRPYDLDKVEEFRPVVPHQGFAEQTADKPDIGSQCRIGNVKGCHVASERSVSILEAGPGTQIFRAQAAVRESDGDDRLAPGVSRSDVADRFTGFTEGVRPVDDRCHPSVFGQLLENVQVRSVRLRNECAQSLANER